MERKRYAVVGLGSRSRMYTWAILGDYRECAELVALCDTNSLRMKWQNETFAEQFGVAPVATYHAHDFERMLAERGVQTLVVTSVDRTHDEYICAALRAGCEVITEKPLTIDAPRAQRILDAARETGRSVTVAFNYRYAPRNSEVRRLLSEGAVGRVLSVHFEWLLDTRHGADYFRRWHRDKHNSGGLMVHKASHHFDLVNWWLDARPERVYAVGRLGFYGRENAERRGVTEFYDRAYGSPIADHDPFALDLAGDPKLKGLYLDAEAEDGYLRDRSVFADGISIEDDVAVLLTYSGGITVSYHLTAYSPWEGYRVAFNGTGGRLEFEVVERSYVSGESDDPNLPVNRTLPGASTDSKVTIRVQKQWREAETIPFESPRGGGHGGADVRLLADLLSSEASPDPLGRRAGLEAGVLAILPGIGANLSFGSRQAVDLRQLVRL